jgi:small-conductance mechanosensitive channel
MVFCSACSKPSPVDDVIIPILNLFGPLVLALTAALIILPLWGINITSVLLGAGVLGLVLGLALQETLGNIFSGLSLLIEAPFRKGDLVLLDDGRTCEVIHLGMRSTMMFSLDEQATIYIPNKSLASGRLINLTKPTPEQRYAIEVTINQSANLAQVSHLLLSIANGHPAVLSSNMVEKLESVKEQIEYIRKSALSLPQNDPIRLMFQQEAEKNEQNLAKLELEGQFNARVLDLKEALRQLIRGIGSRETHGLNAAERQELFCNYVSPAESAVQAVITQAKAWYEVQDAWLNSNDFWAQRKLWENRSEQLHVHWERLKKTMVTQDDRTELRLDDSTKQLLEWLEKDYKLPPGYWKNPSVAVKSIDGPQTHLQLWYYVDNIRLEHDSRSQRVRSELSRIIQERLFSGV